MYTDLKSIAKPILNWCESNDIELNTKKAKALTSADTWNKLKLLYDTATDLMDAIGTGEYSDFNVFRELVQKELKAQKSKLSGAQVNVILNAISWYDESAEKVIKKKQKLSSEKLGQLLERLGCTTEQLPNFGYYPSGKKDEYITYESESDLRDFENVPLKENIHDYYLREVKPHVAEAWIDLEKTKIGYEISFNKYFYQHKPLRSLDEVTAEILQLEKDSEGLIMDILKLSN